MADDFWKTVRQKAADNIKGIEYRHISDNWLWYELSDGRNIRIADVDGDIWVSYWDSVTALNASVNKYVPPRKVVGLAKQFITVAENI